MRFFPVLLVLPVLYACGSTCEKKDFHQAYQLIFEEDSGGTCGPLADMVVTLPRATTSSECNLVYHADMENCEARATTWCSGTENVTFSEIHHIVNADSHQLESTLKLTRQGATSCNSTYSAVGLIDSMAK